MKTPLLFTACLGLLSACTTSSAEEKMASWNGEKSDQLVAVWGKPSEIAATPGGGQTYVYKVEDARMHIVEGGARSGGERFEQELVECTVRFTVDATQHVKSSGIEASGRNCSGEIEANPNRALAH